MIPKQLTPECFDQMCQRVGTILKALAISVLHCDTLTQRKIYFTLEMAIVLNFFFFLILTKIVVIKIYLTITSRGL